MPWIMKNYNLSSELNRYFPTYVLNIVRYAGNEASSTGKELFLVGGAVRDLFLKRTNMDIDMVIEGDAISLAQQIADGTQSRLTLHARFGTATIRFNEFSIDIATARRETYTKPGALPTVQPGTIEDDLYRRDFSINAMAVSLSPDNYGALLDIYKGKQDLDHHLIRILHSRSFVDDATRMLRACRYEQRLRFTLEHETEDLARRDASMLGTISGNRLRHELELILKEEQPEKVLKRAMELGLLTRLHHSIKGNGWLAKKYNRVRQITGQSNAPTLYLCLMIYTLSNDELKQFISYLNFSKNMERTLLGTLAIKARLSELVHPEMKPGDIYNLLNSYTIPAIQANSLATESPVIASHLNLYVNKLRYVKTALSGNDLIKMGISPGPQFTTIFKSLHRAKLNGDLHTREDEKNFVSRFTGSL
jgi:tRNA nucleotidyltransferase (CCA-adding enzyme)